MRPCTSKVPAAGVDDSTGTRWSPCHFYCKNMIGWQQIAWVEGYSVRAQKGIRRYSSFGASAYYMGEPPRCRWTPECGFVPPACVGASSEFYERSSSRRWPPDAGSASLEARDDAVSHGIGAVPDGIGSRPAFPARARARSGRAHRWPPEGGSASLEARADGVPHGIGAVPDGIGLCPLAPVPAAAGHGGGTVEQGRRLCGGIVRILRKLSEPPGGRRWPPEGGSASMEARGGGVHDENRGVA